MSRVGLSLTLWSNGGACLNPISKVGTSLTLTLHVQWWNMSDCHDQGWNCFGLFPMDDFLLPRHTTIWVALSSHMNDQDSFFSSPQ